MSDQDRDVLDLLHEVLENERTFYGILRFLDAGTRNHIVAAHMRNVSTELTLLRQYIVTPPVTNVVMNIPLGSMDLSGNFFDPVPVIATTQQINAAVERHIGVRDANCAICQEAVPCATRIRACGHCFHESCIMQWFTMNTRCPVCRHDIRNLHAANTNVNNDQGNRMYSDS